MSGKVVVDQGGFIKEKFIRLLLSLFSGMLLLLGVLWALGLHPTRDLPKLWGA